MSVEFPKVKIIANTDPEPFPLSSQLVIAPYGFYVGGKDLEAGIVARWEGRDYPDGLSFLKEGEDSWIYQNGVLQKER